MLDLGPRMRIALAACWIAGQAALVLTAPVRADHIFGFRMFPEASTIEIRLTRLTSAGPVAAPSGEWSARDRDGQLRHFSWHDRVRDPILGSLDTRIFASYGADAQLARLQLAVDDVASHIDGDDETHQLLLDVRVWKNGRDPVVATIVSRARAGR